MVGSMLSGGGTKLKGDFQMGKHHREIDETGVSASKNSEMNKTLKNRILVTLSTFAVNVPSEQM
jgi:hypothetical protein